MKKIDLVQRRRNEKAIIDALLKISEIVHKTEINRQHSKSPSTNKHSKKTVGDGDCNDLSNDELQKVPVPPTMHALDSYVSGLSQQSLQNPSNCNETSIHKSKQSISNSLWNSEDKSKTQLR